MTEENSRVHIYLPSHNEADAIAVHAISMGGGAGKNPRNKSFSTPANMAMEMKEDHYSFDAGGSSLYIGIDGAFKLTGKSIQLITQAEFSVGNEIQPKSIEVEAKNELNFHVEGTSIALTEDACIVAAFIAHSAVKKSVPSPSAETLEAEVRANDAAIMTQINENAEAYLMSLADQRASARQQVHKGITGLIGTALIAGVLIATGGLAAAPIAAAAAAITVTNGIMFSASDICQGRENYHKANQGDMNLDRKSVV